MRSRLGAFPTTRGDRLATLFGEVESVSAELSESEVLDAVGRVARLDLVLRARHALLVAPKPSAPATDAPRYLDAEEAAVYIGVSKSTFNRLAKARTILGCRPSEGTVRFDRGDLDGYMAATRDSSPAPRGDQAPAVHRGVAGPQQR